MSPVWAIGLASSIWLLTGLRDGMEPSRQTACRHPACPSDTGCRFPTEIVSYAVWLYFRFPPSLRMVDELLAARGIVAGHDATRRWSLKFGRAFANQVRRKLPAAGDKWRLDKAVLTISGVKHCKRCSAAIVPG